MISFAILQFSLGFFCFIDAAAYSHSSRNASNSHITFVDWIPLICSALGMMIINSIEKTRLSADSFSYSGSGVAWKARLVLFLGFALMAGGLAGSVTVLVFKYIRGSGGGGTAVGISSSTMWMWIANVVGNSLVMLRYVGSKLLLSRSCSPLCLTSGMRILCDLLFHPC